MSVGVVVRDWNPGRCCGARIGPAARRLAAEGLSSEAEAGL